MPVSLEPFISRDDLGDFLGSNLATSDKALIAVDSACDIVRTLTGQTFNEVLDETVEMDGTGTDALLLPELPVTEVSLVYENDELLVEDVDYKLNGDSLLLRLPTLVESGWSTQSIRAVWPVGRNNLEVTYSHGYTDDLLPRDIRMVALSIAARTYQQSAGASGSVVSETIGQYSVRYSDSSSTSSSDLNFSEKTILRKYRVSTGAATVVATS